MNPCCPDDDRSNQSEVHYVDEVAYYYALVAFHLNRNRASINQRNQQTKRRKDTVLVIANCELRFGGDCIEPT